MPQMLLPIFPRELTLINNKIGFEEKNGSVYYFNGMMPFFSHAKDDLASFQFIAAQMYVLGNASQADIVRAFGISAVSMKRYVKKYREKGPAGFFAKRQGRGSSVLTNSVLENIQCMLDDGVEVSTIADELDLKADTLNKAIRDGRLHKPLKKTPSPARKAPAR